eukprot:9431734-Pyramimonas_sp.AAC.1
MQLVSPAPPCPGGAPELKEAPCAGARTKLCCVSVSVRVCVIHMCISKWEVQFPTDGEDTPRCNIRPRRRARKRSNDTQQFTP